MDSVDQPPRIELNDVSIDHLASIRKWGFFLSIMGFIGSGFIILMAVILAFVTSIVPSSEGLGAIPGVLIFFIYSIIGVLYLIPSFLLLKFSSRLKVALHLRATETLAEGLQYLKFLFTYMGAMAILTVLVCVLGVLAAVAITIFAGMHGGT